MILIANPAGILHVCGGDPKATAVGKTLDVYSPRMWR